MFGFRSLWLQSISKPRNTQQLVSGVGLNAYNKSDGESAEESSRKLGEMKSDMTASMNAKMDELNEKLSSNEEEIKDDFNIKLAAHKEELKNDFKEIMDDKLKEVEGRMDEKFREMEVKIEAVENKFEGMENKLSCMNNDMTVKIKEDITAVMDAKIREKVETVSTVLRNDPEELKQQVMARQGDEFKFQAPHSKPSIKLSMYDGKNSWQVYNTQFSIVADAIQWDSQTKACLLAASLRADAADIMQTLPEQ